MDPTSRDSESFVIIENEDIGLRYSEGWNVIIPDPREKRVGMTWTEMENASVEVEFYGSSASIYGRHFGSTSSDKVFNVILDGTSIGSSSTSQPLSNDVSQRLFTTPLTALSNHTLSFTVLSSGVPFYLDYLNITLTAPADIGGLSSSTIPPTATSLPAGTAVSQSSSAADSEPTLGFTQTHASLPAGAIVGGVLGGIVFLAVVGLWAVLRRKKTRGNFEDDMEKHFERIVPGWKRETNDDDAKGGQGKDSDKEKRRNLKGKGDKRSKPTSHSYSSSKRGHHRPPRLKPITFARDPEDSDDSDSPTSVTRVMRHDKRYRHSPSLPPISPVSPFRETEFGQGEGSTGCGSGLEDGSEPRVSVSDSRGRGGGSEVQANDMGEFEMDDRMMVGEMLRGDVMRGGLATANDNNTGINGEKGQLDSRIT